MSFQSESPVLFAGKLASGVTQYIPIPVRKGTIGAQIGWLDAVSSATITLELSSFAEVSSTVAGTAWQWSDSGLTITGPAASAAGSVRIDVENCRQPLARIKIVTAAISNFDIRDGTAIA